MSEAKKILYYALGISALVHIIIIGLLEPEAVTWLIALVIVVLIVFLWRATTGRRGALFTGLGLAICILAIAWAVVFYSWPSSRRSPKSRWRCWRPWARPTYRPTLPGSRMLPLWVAICWVPCCPALRYWVRSAAPRRRSCLSTRSRWYSCRRPRRLYRKRSACGRSC